MNCFLKWMLQPAEWYEFWLPQSGIKGGAVCALLICAGILFFYGNWYLWGWFIRLHVGDCP